MGETIHQEAISSDCCPIKALAHEVCHIFSNGGTHDNLICDYFIDGVKHSTESKDIMDMVRHAASLLELSEYSVDPDLLGSHSLWAGGAMSLKLHGFADITIMKMSRWTSLTFLQYIHNQIAHISNNVSSKMSELLPFLNIAAIEGIF